MRRPVLRGFSALVALVLLPSIAPDALGRGCPHHLGHEAGGGGGVAGEHGHGSNAHANDAHRNDLHSHAPGTGTHRDAGTGHDDVPPPCTCVGSCPTSSGPAAPTAPPPVALATATTSTAPTTLAARQPSPRRAPYTLPLANAPPLT